MREVYRERDFSRVGHLQSVLEAEGIPTFVRNQHVVTAVTQVPIPDLFPAICVVNDEDYERARRILSDYTEVDTPREPVAERPMPLVFLLGVLLLFGGYGSFFLISLLHEWASANLFVSGFRLAVMIGCYWIVSANVRRFLQDRAQPVVSVGTGV